MIGNKSYTWSGSQLQNSNTDLVSYGFFDVRLDDVARRQLRSIVNNNGEVICPHASRLIAFSYDNSKVVVKKISDRKINLTK